MKLFTTSRRNPSNRSAQLLGLLIAFAFAAGLVLPYCLGRAACARWSEVRITLAEMQAAIAEYYANAAVTGDATYPTLVELVAPGAVIDAPVPVNPYRGTNAVQHAIWSASEPPVFGSAGWNYDEQTGRFWPNSVVEAEHTLGLAD